MVVSGHGDTIHVQTEAEIMKMNSLSVEELTHQEKFEFLFILGRNLSEFTSKANKEVNIFSILKPLFL